jgi:16S rRNA (guanine527-N7)-methyltransferase
VAKASAPRDARSRTPARTRSGAPPRLAPGDAPPIDAASIADAVAQLPLALSAAQCDTLARFAALLAKWNRVHNLTARESAHDLLVLHLLDSLSIVGPLRAAVAGLASAASSVLDVGSGGGLPGIPLAIAEPLLHVTLIDKVAKKVAFLQQAKAELRLSNVECFAGRVEDFVPPHRFDVVTSRALGSLADFTRATRHLLADGGLWAAMKGAVPRAEIAALPASVAVRDIVKLRVPRLEAERHLVLLQPR